MRICVLQPSYEGSSVDYQHYDPRRDLSPLLPQHRFHHAFIRKASSFRQIRELRRQGFDIYVNLCEGYLDWDIPSSDVIVALDRLGLAYTGPNLALYDPPKHLMKIVACSEGVASPPYVLAETEQDATEAARLKFPLFVKPNRAGDSRGIDGDALVLDPPALRSKVAAIVKDYDEALIEEYVDGREFSVLVCGDPDPAREPLALLPLEFVFPEGLLFKTYDLKVTQFHPECNVPCADPELAMRLREAARRVFRGFVGQGYARMDFRVSSDREVVLLDVNFTCSVFYPDGFQGSADYILAHDGLGQRGFLERIIAEGLARHARKQKAWVVRPARLGYGVFASRAIARGEVVFAGEGRAHRIITRSYVARHWSSSEQEVFRRYAYPLGPEVYALWDEDPAGWMPQNHSCDPNTAFVGLNVAATRAIPEGEELTLDYGSFCDEGMAEFECGCGSAACRGKITGRTGGGRPA